MWKIREIQDSPALVVATVEGVARKEPVPPGQTRSSIPEHYWEATLRVHRAYPREAVSAGATITARYVAFREEMGQIGGPIWPRFAKGVTALFALAPIGGARWRLVADEGENLTVPAIVEDFQAREAPHSGRSFIIGELVNTLANGSAARRSAAASYLINELLFQDQEVWPDLRAMLEQTLGTDDDQWLEVACAVLAGLGTPHVPIGQLMTNPNPPGAHNQAAAWLLAKGAKRDYPDRLIRCILRNLPAYEGAVFTLLDFKDSPLLIRETTALLARDPGGSINVAWRLVRGGQRAFLPEALDAAVKLVSDPGPVAQYSLRAASYLLDDYGSDRQFDVIPATLRRLKNENEDQYRKLFLSGDTSYSKRWLRVAAVAIDDHRPWNGELRYCDLAAAMVAGVSGEFQFRQGMTSEERDRAVAQAAAWLDSHRDAFQTAP
jgi:hypothetical protein